MEITRDVSLAVQVKYPEEYNGCFAACPDPIDFKAYCLTNIYEDKNAYYYESDYKKIEVPAHRDYLGHVQTTVREYIIWNWFWEPIHVQDNNGH